MLEKEILGVVYKIRDDLTLGEISSVIDKSTIIDPKTGFPLTQVGKARAKLISIAVAEPKMTEAQASELKAGVGLKLHSEIQEANALPL